MTTESEYTDIRLIPLSAEHLSCLMSEDPLSILKCVRFVIDAYEKAPPLTLQQAIAYSSDVEWWRAELGDIDPEAGTA